MEEKGATVGNPREQMANRHVTYRQYPRPVSTEEHTSPTCSQLW